jgi:hypothetical protein
MSEKSNKDPEGRVLPPKDQRKKGRGSTVWMEAWVWDELDAIAEESGEYSRNEVIQRACERLITAWHAERKPEGRK